MLRAYRRHRESCAHRDEGRACRTCRCLIWVQGFLGDQEIRKSLGLRDRQKADKKLREWETAGVRAIHRETYNPRNRARQEQAETDVARSWALGTIVLLEEE
jgi:hypothetical protein